MMTSIPPAAPEGAAPPQDAPAMDEPETITAPVAVLGDVSPGDMVSLKVVSVDGDTATLAMAQDEPEGDGGTDGMADEFKTPAPQ